MNCIYLCKELLEGNCEYGEGCKNKCNKGCRAGIEDCDYNCLKRRIKLDIWNCAKQCGERNRNKMKDYRKNKYIQK